MMQTQSRNRMVSTARTRRRFFTPMMAMAALTLCLPVGSVPAQPSAGATPGRASQSQSRIESQAPTELSTTQALQAMLELIRTSHRVTDITQDTVDRIFGVQTKVTAQDEFGYGQRLPGNWAFSIQRLVIPGIGTRVDLGFDPIPGTQAAPLTACEPNFAQFTGALESMGFSRRTLYREHGRWIGDSFERPGMVVQVYARTAFTDTGEPRGPVCVRMVLAQ